MTGNLIPKPAIQMGAAEMRETALAHMIQALEWVDRDTSLSGLVGARLQAAIDSMYIECGIEPPLPDFS